ncbi:MAG TPA: ferritin-like domain-containing protein [Pyrinomonadaceae bacterium]|nr:ferritin-like domain-containing protein [Pyrinomonadaceae bacterium]
MILLKDVKIETIEDVRDAVQQAVELEHSTIPPYLTANFTLNNTGNDDISNLIGSILGEEMLHLTIAGNLLNAVGGTPVINKPPFIPTYPGPLPGGVETGLVVPIAKFSKDLIKNVFMVIEEPENKINIKKAAADGKITIGQFYQKIKKQLEELEREAKKKKKTIFTGDAKNQVTFEEFFPKKLLFPITDLKTALRGIDIIVNQGEGTTIDPFVNPDDTMTPEPAHYYRFQEIVKGKRLVKDPKAPSGYSYSGDPIPFDGSLIPNMRENPKMNDYPVASPAYVNSKLFNYSYTSLLNSLHRAFNGEPEQIKAAMGLMFSVRLYALKLLALEDPNNPGYTAGPSFEYVSDEDMTPADRKSLVENGLVVKLSSSDILNSKNFYTDILGCTIDARYTLNSDGKFGKDSYLQLNLPGLNSNIAIGLYKDIDAPLPKQDPSATPGTAPTFVVADIKSVRQSLINKGVSVGEIIENKSDQGYVDFFAFFQDPDNNTLVLRQNVSLAKLN